MTALLEKVNRLNEIGIALSIERDSGRLLDKILFNAKLLTNADGATIYSVTEENKLHFEIVTTDSLNYRLGEIYGWAIPFPDLPLFTIDGKENDRLIAAYVVNHKQTVNIADAYFEEGFDFSGTREFDKTTGYRTKAVLTVPIINHEDEVIAVMQLINPIDPVSGEVHPFTEEDQKLAESLASQAGVALTNQRLIAALTELFESLIRVIAEAIDEKSPVTGNHGKRVPIIAEMLAQAVNHVSEGPLRGEHFTPAEIYELNIAAFLHDCGKIVTPVHIVEKQNKLEGIFDRIEVIQGRIEILKRDAKIALLEGKITEKTYRENIQKLEEIFALLKRCNTLQEKITPEVIENVEKLSFLTPAEKKSLLVAKGNLTEEERAIIEHHVIMTKRMLAQLPFPKHLKKVPEIATSHHEWVDGRGYPRHLKGEQMSLRAKILAIADVFEALSAPDRPYKKPLPLSQIYAIMGEMVKEGHLDPNLYEVFIKEKVALRYAQNHCSPSQVDME